MDSDDVDTFNLGTGDTIAAPSGPARARSSVASYEVSGVLGRGGMGEVLLARDPKIGRDVAIKRMSTDRPGRDAIARFLREAKIQARLEHPAIVPVHEVGDDADGCPYFTMKRLAGTTLHQVIRAGTDQPRMLRALVDVCLAIELAHTRDIIHRDLKPANVMLGDFGEVYVLDWGIARIAAGADVRSSSLEIEGEPGDTVAGSMLGTPGYMAPEQVRDAASVGPHADVYSLGCILFEILTGEPLHPPGDALQSTLTTTEVSVAARCPERAIAPELAAACEAALAPEPDARPTARSLADRIQRYLDGDRDLERRRALAADALAHARAIAGDPARRADAMRSAGRAVALDPDSAAAAELAARLILEPPPEAPPEIERRLTDLDRRTIAHASQAGPKIVALYFLCSPLALWSGITDWGAAIALSVYMAACGVFWHVSGNRMLAALERGEPYAPINTIIRSVVSMCLTVIIAVGVARVLGPLVFAPAVLIVIMTTFTQHPAFIERPYIGVGVGTLAFIGPILLERADVLGRTLEVAEGRIIMSSSFLQIGGYATWGLVVLANLSMMIAAALYTRSIAVRYRVAQRALLLRAWHLEQLLPEGQLGAHPAAPDRRSETLNPLVVGSSPTALT